MKKILFKLMEFFPLLEVWAQCIYAGLNQEKRAKIKKYVKTVSDSNEEKVSISELANEIKKLGIQKGDLVMVHSSMGGLKNLSGSPAELISAILEILGDEGTLAMAAFPHYKDKDVLEIENEKYLVYDVKHTGVSTGLLPMVFCKTQGVVRSSCPMNTIAVCGKLAEDMLKNEDKSDLAHGEFSAWNYLAEQHAKVLYLGLEVIEADTIVHVVEDVMDADWPIENWYVKQKYIVKDGPKEKKVTLRVRDGFWHRYFTAHYSGRLMQNNHFVEKRNVKGIKLELVKDAGEYVDFLMQQAKKRRLLYRIPKKYWKKGKTINGKEAV